MTSTPLSFVRLEPDAYDRAKSVLNRAKHPGFVGRELYYRCATAGSAIVAVRDGIDVGVSLATRRRTRSSTSSARAWSAPTVIPWASMA